MTNLSTGTAADLLSFETIKHVTKNVERLTRVATASQEWILKDWDGETYLVKFDKNFSKKHLFTFSKDTERTKAQADIESKKPNQAGKDAENWHNAEIELLKNKIAKNIDKRAVADVCVCGHKFDKHLTPNPPRVPAPCRGGFGIACTAGAGGAACAQFRTPYGLAREYVGKPTHDPLSGAKTSKNTCIIMNWVPKAEFEQVVVNSIQALEKPPGWAKGQPLAIAVSPAGHTLRWDFGPARIGAVLVADKTGAAVTPTYTNFQGCYVTAEKTASAYGKQTWIISHMQNAPGGLDPF